MPAWRGAPSLAQGWPASGPGRRASSSRAAATSGVFASQSDPGAAAPALGPALPGEGPGRRAFRRVANSRRTRRSAPPPEVSARELGVPSQRRQLGTNLQVTSCELQRPLVQISPRSHRRPTRKGESSAGTGRARGQFKTRGGVTRPALRPWRFLGLAKGQDGLATQICKKWS